MDKICISKVVAIGLLIIIISLIIYQYMSNQININNLKKTILSEQQPCSKSCPTCTKSSCPMQSCPICTKTDYASSYSESKLNNNIQEIPPQQIVQQQILPQQIMANPIRDYDYRTLTDPLVPPYKRDDFQIPLSSIATRGYPSSFKKMGTLIDKDAQNKDQYKFMILVGRQKYPGSNYYDYYITENTTDSPLKFDLEKIHKEFMTDDEIYVKELNKKYTVKIDRNLGFDYNPFII